MHIVSNSTNFLLVGQHIIFWSALFAWSVVLVSVAVTVNQMCHFSYFVTSVTVSFNLEASLLFKLLTDYDWGRRRQITWSAASYACSKLLAILFLLPGTVRQRLKWHGMQGNTIPSPPIYGAMRSPTSVVLKDTGIEKQNAPLTRDLRIVFLRSNRISNRIGHPIRFRIEFSNRIGRIYHASRNTV